MIGCARVGSQDGPQAHAQAQGMARARSWRVSSCARVGSQDGPQAHAQAQGMAQACSWRVSSCVRLGVVSTRVVTVTSLGSVPGYPQAMGHLWGIKNN
ncbi:hypothetical protein U1Q18_006535 [Sarracenia purpurea var. burkii]